MEELRRFRLTQAALDEDIPLAGWALFLMDGRHKEREGDLPFGRLDEPFGQTHYRHQKRDQSSPQSSALGK